MVKFIKIKFVKQNYSSSVQDLLHYPLLFSFDTRQSVLIQYTVHASLFPAEIVI
jgi:hypothetical protein